MNLLQFFKCYETTKISPFMYDPYNPIKKHFPQKTFCYHVYHIPVLRSSHRRCSVKNILLKIWEISHKKNLCWRLLKACNFIKKDSNADAFYVKFSKILRTPICKRVKAPQKNKSIACIRMVNDTIEQQILFIENMNLMKLVCAMFTLYQNAFFVSSFRPQKRA